MESALDNRQSIIADLRNPDIEIKKIGLARINEVDLDPFRDEIMILLSDAAADIRWLAVNLLCKASLKEKDLTFYLKRLELLFTNDHKASWFKAGYSVGDLALSATVYHWINKNQWENIKELLESFQSEKPMISAILGCFRTSYEKRDITPLLPLLHPYRMDESPEIRGKAVAVLTGYYYWEQRFDEIEKFLTDEDYATRWYTLSALDDIAESGGDVSLLFPVLIGFFHYPDAELEKNRNVKYTATLRELAAGVIIWHMIKTKAFRTAKPSIIHGVDLKQIPEIKTIMKEMRSYTKNPDK
jgi:hypothetical protein